MVPLGPLNFYLETAQGEMSFPLSANGFPVAVRVLWRSLLLQLQQPCLPCLVGNAWAEPEHGLRSSGARLHQGRGAIAAPTVKWSITSPCKRGLRVPHGREPLSAAPARSRSAGSPDGWALPARGGRDPRSATAIRTPGFSLTRAEVRTRPRLWGKPFCPPNVHLPPGREQRS